MPDRIYMGFLNGGFVARVSRPGFDVKSAPDYGYLFREDTASIRPVTSGSIPFGGAGSIAVALSGLTDAPFVILKSNDSSVPSLDNYYAKINATFTTLTVVNVRGIARTLSYFVFGPMNQA